MDGSSHYTIGYRLNGESECKWRKVGSPPMNLRVRGFRELTISMAECEGLALVTLTKMKKMTKLINEN